MLTSKALLVAILCSVFSLCPLLYGQANGSFSGTVTDKTGSVIAGATVRVTSPSNGLTREAKTDGSGHYLVPLLPVSFYAIRVEAQGFQTTEQKDIRLQVDEQREIDFSLNPASVSQTVEVNAEEVAVETTNPTLGQVITSEQVADLPLNGRDFVQLASLTAGATQETNPNSFFTQGADSEVAARGSFSLSVGGSRPNSTDWLLDGVDNNELTAGGIGIFSSIDDIQEFKVLTYNYSAEYGTRAGPTVLVTTKSGSNAFHGSLFEFLRNTDLDAKSFFATSAEKFNLNQYGGSIGGPIQKDKTFFFLDGEQKDQRHGIAFTGLLPSEAMRNGDFSADPFGNPIFGSVMLPGSTTPIPVPAIVNPNMIGAVGSAAASANPNLFPNIYFQCDGSGNPLPVNSEGMQAQGTNCAKIPTGANGLANPIGQALINLYPTPNANLGVAGASFNFVSQPVRSLDETKFDVRLDHNISTNDSVFGRFSYDQANSYVPGGAGPGFLTEASAFGSNQRIINHGRQVAIGETHTFSPTTVNQATFGYNRIFDYITSQGTGTCASATIGGGIPGANLGCPNGTDTCEPGAYSCGLVSVLLFGGYWSIGDRGYSPFQGGTNIFSFGDTLDLIRGKHDFKVGLALRANQMNVGTEAFQDGFWIPGVAGNFSGFTGTTGTDANAVNATIAGNPEADVVLGLLGLGEHDQTFNGPVTGRRWKIYRPFVQDDWRATKSLTLNLGLAWDLTTPISEEHGRMADYDPFANKLLVANQNGVSSSAGIKMNWTAFEPRLGLAWKVAGSDKTVVRAGYAIFHDSAWSQGAQGLWQNPPFFAEGDIFGPAGCAFASSYCALNGGTPTGSSISSGFPIFNSPPSLSSFTGTLFYQPTNFKLGVVQQYNVNVERQLPGNVVLTAGYAGAHGHHLLLSGNDINTPGPPACGMVTGYTIGCNPNGSQFIPSYPLDTVGNGNAILEFGDLGKTTYNSLQIKAETKTPRYGLYALISYTYSHTYDDGLTDGLGSLLSAPYFPLPNWPKLDWGLSQINLDNNFTASVIYDLPFGRGKMFGANWNSATNTALGNWQVTLIEHISSGFPDPLIDSNDQSGVGFFGAGFNNGGNGNNYNRPNQVAGCNPYAADHGKQQWFSVTCFPAATPGELGDANRVPVVGPDFVNTDFSVIKQFALPREGIGLNFRAEFFNLFNHAQFGLPVNDISAPGFGSVNSIVNNPRLVQFALKLTF